MSDKNVNSVDNLATDIHENTRLRMKKIKDNSFDAIAVCLVILMALLGLGAVQLRELSIQTFINMVIETVPFYMTASMLSMNYYKKGVYTAKSTSGFINVVNLYSTIVNKLTGHQLDILNDFCMEYNAKVLRRLQESVLLKYSISYRRFNEGTESEPPLKCMSYETLVNKYGEEFANVVQEAKNVTIKGLHANILLSSFGDIDTTNLGPTEHELFRSRTKFYMVTNIVSITFMAFIGIKNILTWGWLGAILVIFKVGYILCKSYMKYFDGYEDITNRVSSHISRKIDILKEFSYWYDEKFQKRDTDMFTSKNNIS